MTFTALPEPTLVLPADRRQSPTALRIQRGVRRLFSEMGCVTLPEFSLVNGRRGGRDRPVRRGAPDHRGDQVERGRLPRRPEMARLPGFLRPVLLRDPRRRPRGPDPEDCGLIVADAYGAAIIREAPEHALSGARRKAVTLRFAHSAARLLHALADPGAVREGAL